MLGDLVTSLSNYMTAISGGNQMIAGALMLWVMGVGSFICKGLPAKIYQTTKKYVTTSMTFNNAGYEKEEVLFNFMEWVQPKMRESMSRTLTIDTSWRGMKKSSILGLGYGIHFFFYNKRLFWLSRDKLDSSGSERQKEEIRLTTYGRSHKPFVDMLSDFTPKEDDTKVNLYTLDADGDWCKTATPPKRDLSTIALSSELKDNILDQITHFKSNREWFYKRGLPYKLSYIIHGKPGGGKTSLIKAIASEFNMNICTININVVSDKTLERALSDMPANSVVIIEDFDSSSASKNRTQMVEGSDAKMFSMLSLTGILNVLDGANPLDDCIVFMTTNHLDSVDEAIYRKGRIDHIIEIAEVSPEDISSYSQMLFPDYDFSEISFKPVMGCHLNEALLYGRDDADLYLESLRANGAVE